VSWRIMVEAADRYTDWQVFTLWLRAVLDASEALPAKVTVEIQKRSPSLMPRIAPHFREDVSALGSRIWEEATQWAEANVFADAKREGWLNAIRYFSAKSLLSVKAWSYWEEVGRKWQTAPPRVLPNYEQWRASVSSVRRL
jgi:hypothetical protein